MLAIRIEQILTKDQILEMYLNQIYWGHNNYGAQTAARSYFNKSVGNLTLAESAMMAGLIKAPQEYSPFINMKKGNGATAYSTAADERLRLDYTPRRNQGPRPKKSSLARLNHFKVVPALM